MTKAIGIDLGTTYSCVGVWEDGRVEIIANDQGNRTTPSYVAFTEEERLVGDGAKNQASLNPTNTIFDAKRLIGRRFDDSEVQSDMKRWPFTVINGKGGMPLIQIIHNDEKKTFEPEVISSMILLKMKETASAYLDSTVDRAVITVPVHFNDAQRQATKDAGTIAGLEVLQIINEPTAAALAYGLQKQVNAERNVLIFDLGGGTFDISLLTIDDGVFEVKATAGNTHLGGEDFDNKLVDHFAAEFKRKFKRDISDNPRAMRRLRTACERAKRILSTMAQASIEIDALFDGIDFYTSMTRARFEDICSDLFIQIIEPLTKVLQDAKMDKNSVHDVVLVGGSTRIPKIQHMVSDFFKGKKIAKSINADEAVAYGAAARAAMLTGDTTAQIDSLMLIDVAPLSLGIETSGGIMSPVIERNTTVPTKKSRLFTTSHDNQAVIRIAVFEGERKFVADNHLLGEFRLTGLAPAPRHEPTFEVTFEIDANGILDVSAVDKGSGKSNQITITTGKSRLSKEDIERLVREAAEYKEADEAAKARMYVRNSLESYVYDLKSKLQSREDQSKLPRKIENIKKQVQENITWLENNQNAKMEDYITRYQTLKKVVGTHL